MRIDEKEGKKRKERGKRKEGVRERGRKEGRRRVIKSGGGE